MNFLAADIGGTYTRLLLGETCAGGWRSVRQQRFRGHDYASLADVLAEFLLPGEALQAACIAVAGPVHQQRVSMTNLPWQLDARQLSEQWRIPQVRLLNDFAAQAHGLASLPASDLCTLQAGQPDPDGVRALLGAGTGLGMALLVPCGGTWQALPSQGGLADFAPVDAEQVALYQALRAAYGRVSQELLLSGHGLERIYAFVRGASVRLDADAPDAAAISRAAEQGDAQASAALALFARIYGACAGNLALTALARGGVYLSGGIAPKMLGFLQQPEVLAAFNGKAPMDELLQSIPLHVVRNEQLGLHGAATLAAQLCQAGATKGLAHA